MRTKRQSKRKPPAEDLPAAETLPPWLPTGERWESLPQNLRQAVLRLLTPAYRQFVLDAPDELQRSIGLTLVHLLWLELCSQARLGDVVAAPTCLAAVLNDPEEMIGRYLNLVAAKNQTTELLVKLRLVNEALARSAATPTPRLPPPVGDRPEFCGRTLQKTGLSPLDPPSDSSTGNSPPAAFPASSN
jgi:hypothetical protein